MIYRNLQSNFIQQNNLYPTLLSWPLHLESRPFTICLNLSTLEIYKKLAGNKSLPIRIVFGLRSDCEPEKCASEFINLKKYL